MCWPSQEGRLGFSSDIGPLPCAFVLAGAGASFEPAPGDALCRRGCRAAFLLPGPLALQLDRRYLGLEAEQALGIAAENIALGRIREERLIVDHARQIHVPMRIVGR